MTTYPRLSFLSTIKYALLFPKAFINSFARKSKVSAEDVNDIENFATRLSINSQEAVAGEKILLLMSFLPLPYCLKIEGLIARSMQEQGYRVIVLTNMNCRELVSAYYSRVFGFEILLIENFLSVTSEQNYRKSFTKLFQTKVDLLESIKEYCYRGVYVGRPSLATLSSTILDGKIELNLDQQKKLQRIIKKSILYTDAAYRIIQKLKPHLMLGVEKGFVGTSEIFYAALESKVDYVQWVACHEPNSIMLKRYHWDNFRDHPFSLSGKTWNYIRSLSWTPSQSNAIMEQFESGYKDGIWFKHKFLDLTGEQYQKIPSELIKELGLDPSRKTAVIYSHILNDANLFYGKDLFKGGFEEWLVETVRVAATTPDVNWVLKVHPANVYRNAKIGYDGIYGEIHALQKAFGEVPAFLKVVYPEEKISPLSFFKLSDYGITVRGTVGLELPCFGVPTLTAGTGRYSGRGFTVDSDTKEEYLEKIKNIHLIPRLNQEQTEMGRRYAYYIFRSRPAKYSQIFKDVYKFPVNHPRHRDVELQNGSFAEISQNTQMINIVSFLMSTEEDFIELNFDDAGSGNHISGTKSGFQYE